MACFQKAIVATHIYGDVGYGLDIIGQIDPSAISGLPRRGSARAVFPTGRVLRTNLGRLLLQDQRSSCVDLYGLRGRKRCYRGHGVRESLEWGVCASYAGVDIQLSTWVRTGASVTRRCRGTSERRVKNAGGYDSESDSNKGPPSHSVSQSRKVSFARNAVVYGRTTDPVGRLLGKRGLGWDWLHRHSGLSASRRAQAL